VQFKDVTGTVFIETISEGYFSKVLNDVSQSTLNKDTSSKGQKESSMFGSLFSAKDKVKATESISKTEQVADYFSFVGESITPFASKLTNRVRVEVVKNVDIEPKFKSLYLGQNAQTFNLNIRFGSGHFAVSLNDTGLADLVHKEREVLITPKKHGALLIRVEDLLLPDAEIATSSILISEI
jgi:hypothetical protein